MDKIINIKIRNRIATVATGEYFICGNEDYTVVFDFDEEWDSIAVKTARFQFNGSHVDLVFEGNEVAAPEFSNITHVEIGVFAGDITSTPARVTCFKSILCKGGAVHTPPDDVYAQIIALLNDSTTSDNIEGIGLIESTQIGEKVKAFSQLLNNTDAVESFIFFTDPHLLDTSGYEARFREYIQTLKSYYAYTPTSFVLCGGDWIGNSDTPSEACFKLGYMDGWMRSNFDKYFPVVGNHDTNYQGNDEDGNTLAGTLTNETIRNLMVRNEDNMYYSFDGKNTKFYVLETGSDWVESMDDYRWEQIAWLANELKTDDAPYSAIALHIWNAPFANNVFSLCGAYNNATTITLNGVTYDFTGCAGKVKFALAGHTHADSVEEINGIVVIATTNMRSGDVPTFDLCLADYDKNVINMVRIGTGESRTVSLTETKKSDIYLLRGFARTGQYLFPQSIRSVYVSTEPCYETTPAEQYSSSDYTGVEWDDYYPIKIPDGATQVTVTCPADVKWAYLGQNSTSGRFLNNESVDSGWLTPGGGTYTINSSNKICLILFHNNSGTDMSADDYDASAFSITFS